MRFAPLLVVAAPMLVPPAGAPFDITIVPVPDLEIAIIPDEPAMAFADLVAAKHWRERQAARARLVALGEAALVVVQRGAQSHEDADVRRACLEVLFEAFPTDDRAVRTIVNHGLADADAPLRYASAFHLGEHRVFVAFRRLVTMLETEENDLARLAAAKSLAELGDGRGLPLLYDALGSDAYMSRHLAHLGYSAISGRSPAAFAYDYTEGARVSGGVETRFARRPIEDAERRAARFEAIAAYCRWLKFERPDLFKYIDGGH